MSQSEKRSAAGAVGAKTARACDSCLQRRARWYCAADDAFLCQGCDSAVHSANSLARRHERLRLKTSSSSSFKTNVDPDDDDSEEPTWHHGFKRKARTPRGGAKSSMPADAGGVVKIDPLVPDLETASLEDCAAVEEEQLLYRVPIFDPVLSEFCSPPGSFDDVKPPAVAGHQPIHVATPVQGLPLFLPSNMDLAEFEIDMESLLGRGLDEDSFCMEGLGLMDSPEEGGSGNAGCSLTGTCYDAMVKEEETDDSDLIATACHVDGEMDLSRETLDINFDCGSPTTGEDTSEEEEKVVGFGMAAAAEGKRRRIMLSLDYDAVITAWSSHGSPWTNGERPELNPDERWPDYTGMMWVGGSGGELQGGMYNGGAAQLGSSQGSGDGGREARVSRYREKRRTRLFSKKIRYEVRKLNAEKRPRMKGRFVKRASFTISTAAAGAASAATAPPQFV